MPLNVGIIGTGNIAPAYLKGSSNYPEDITITTVADLDMARAQNFAAEHGLTAMTVAELLANPDIDIVINLTVPLVHAEVSQQIIAAGKSVYTEKPLATNREDGRRIIEAAKAKGVFVGSAPDTFLGSSGQTARKALDEGVIGTPVAATAIFVSPGPDSWHPNPFFYYQTGGGPVFDMAPYYLTTSINLFGPVTHVTAMAGRGMTNRVAGHATIKGQPIPISVDTHTAGTLRFENGVIATVIFSFDVWAANLPRIEVYGTNGSIAVPDPNRFDGETKVWTSTKREWEILSPVGRADIQRGAGVADMARAIRDGAPQRASGALGFHVLDIMSALDEAAATGQMVKLSTRVDRPAAVDV